jgi:hypothetical protein
VDLETREERDWNLETREKNIDMIEWGTPEKNKTRYCIL